MNIICVLTTTLNHRDINDTVPVHMLTSCAKPIKVMTEHTQNGEVGVGYA